MNLLRLLGFNKKTDKKEYPYKDILHLWEDHYLMIELLPIDNLEFVKSETRRINNFGKEHFNGIGFTDITLIADKPVKTIDKLIDISEIEKFLTQTGLQKVNQFHMQGVGLIQDNKTTIGFGTNKFAIMCEKKNELLSDIWLTGHTETDENKKRLVDALLLFGHTFNFIAINWYRGEHYNLIERQSVEDFVKNSC